MNPKRLLIRVAITVVALFLVTGVGAQLLHGVARTGFQIATVSETPVASSAPELEGVVAADYYTVTGTASRTYSVTTPGVLSYCPLDTLGRAVCAYGEITSALRNEAQSTGRESINVDPSGWGTNAEVTIPALANIAGSTAYSGWFWNRSHLIADSLGGTAFKENLVTGTRTQNVGSTQIHGQYGGGMAYTELLVREYLDSSLARNCPVYYAATPVYTDAELIPRSVIVDVQSCDKSIDIRVEVSNTAHSFTINYTTGAFAQETVKQ